MLINRYQPVIILVVMAFTVLLIAQSWISKDQQAASLVAEDNLQLKRENSRLRMIQSLSVEFSFDPRIVMTVDTLAREYHSEAKPHYRMLTPEMLSYYFLSLIWAESRGDSQAVGDNGKAYGLTQMWLSTARQYNKEITEADLLSIEGNLVTAFAHMDYLLEKYRGNVALWLYGWNRGEGRVDALLEIGSRVENGYARKVYLAAELHNRRLSW